MTTEWWIDAECMQYDPELFYPDPSDKEGTDEALSVCRACPVVKQCLQETLRVEASSHAADRHGIRGGQTPTDRANIYRSTRGPGPEREYGTPVKGCGDAAGYQRHRRAGTLPCRGCFEAEAARGKAAKAAKAAQQELAA